MIKEIDIYNLTQCNVQKCFSEVQHFFMYLTHIIFNCQNHPFTFVPMFLLEADKDEANE